MLSSQASCGHRMKGRQLKLQKRNRGRLDEKQKRLRRRLWRQSGRDVGGSSRGHRGMESRVR